MEETPILVDENSKEAQPGSGSLLSLARKKQKRTVEEIAEHLNLSVSQIRSIELDQSEGLPEPTYVRGYIRSYAKLLDLDQNEILGHYLNPNWQKGSSLDEMPRGIEVHEHKRGSWLTPSRFVGVAFLLAVVGFLGYRGYLNIAAIDTPLLSQNESSSSTPASNSDELSLVELGQQDTEQSPEEAASQTTEFDEPTELSEQDSGVVAVDSQVQNDEYQLELSFTDTCWVDIRDENEEKLAYKSYVKGDVLTLSSAVPMSVFVGNVSAVRARVGGSDFDLSPYQEGVFARFSVPIQ